MVGYALDVRGELIVGSRLMNGLAAGEYADNWVIQRLLALPAICTQLPHLQVLDRWAEAPQDPLNFWAPHGAMNQRLGYHH